VITNDPIRIQNGLNRSKLETDPSHLKVSVRDTDYTSRSEGG